MARAHFFRYVLDEDGNVISDATVSIYLAGTITPATIYQSEGAASHVYSVLSASDGSFEFWVDSSDYDPMTQEFKIVAVKSGLVSKTFDYVNVFPCFPHTHSGGGGDIATETMSTFVSDYVPFGAPWVDIMCMTGNHVIATWSQGAEAKPVNTVFLGVSDIQQNSGSGGEIYSVFFADSVITGSTAGIISPWYSATVFESSGNFSFVPIEYVALRGSGKYSYTSDYLNVDVFTCGAGSSGNFGRRVISVADSVTDYFQHGMFMYVAATIRSWPDTSLPSNPAGNFRAEEAYFMSGKFRRGFALGIDNNPIAGSWYAKAEISVAGMDLMDALYEAGSVGMALTQSGDGSRISWGTKAGGVIAQKVWLYSDGTHLYAQRLGGSPQQLD